MPHTTQGVIIVSILEKIGRVLSVTHTSAVSYLLAKTYMLRFKICFAIGWDKLKV